MIAIHPDAEAHAQDALLARLQACQHLSGGLTQIGVDRGIEWRDRVLVRHARSVMGPNGREKILHQKGIHRIDLPFFWTVVAPARLIHRNLAKIYRWQVEQLYDSAEKDEAFDLIRSLIDEIRLVPQDGRLRIELRCELAGILSLAAASKKPGSLSATRFAEQMKMLRGHTTADF